MEIKAKLKIQLLANDVIVAESEDPVLWNRVLQTAQSTAPLPKLIPHFNDNLDDPPQAVPGVDETSTTIEQESEPIHSDKALQRFAKTLSITPEAIEGAFYPSREAPYIRVDSHYWAAFKKNTPSAGKGSFSASVTVATLMSEWFKYAELGEVNRSMITQVLENLGVQTKNVDRNISSCAWLNKQGTTIRLNPSEIAHADKVTKAFCTKQPIGGE